MKYTPDILHALRDFTRFIRLTLSGPAGKKAEWRKVTVRPVATGKGHGKTLQAVFQGEKKQITRSVPLDDIEHFLDELLCMGFRHIDLQCADGDLHIRITRKGKALVSRGKPSVSTQPGAAPHDREKEYPFPAHEPNPFLETLGIMRDAKILSAMQDKFRQINHFLILFGHTKLLKNPPSEIALIDCGCGRAFLTLAAYHYLREKRGLVVRLTGIDADPEVIASAQNLSKSLGYDEVNFVCAPIRKVQPKRTPNVVFSLHACDTATDEAIARGVAWGAEVILCAPCCQHELHHKIERDEFRAVLRHGILRERTADILTDALRAAALRVMGYKTDVIEFISPGHTAKNLMIRAEKARGMRTKEAAREYLALRDFWNVSPCIEELLGDDFTSRLS